MRPAGTSVGLRLRRTPISINVLRGVVVSGQGSKPTSRSMTIAALGFAVWAIGYVAIASPFTTSSWEWALCVLGPLILAVAALSNGPALRETYGPLAFALLVVALLLAAFEFLPLALSISGSSSGWAAASYELWGASWIVGAFGVVAFIARRQSRPSPTAAPGASFAQLSLLSSGMLVYGIGFEELGSDSRSHAFGAVAFAGAALIALSIILQRRSLSARMGGAAAGIVIVVVTGWAVKDFARVTGSLMANATFNKEMIFGLGGIFFALTAVACVLVSRRYSSAD